MKYKVEILKALADDTRLKIVLTLMKKEESVLDIVSFVGKSQPNISIGLKKLEGVGLIQSRKEGKRVIYNITDKEKIQKLLELIHG